MSSSSQLPGFLPRDESPTKRPRKGKAVKKYYEYVLLYLVKDDTSNGAWPPKEDWKGQEVCRVSHGGFAYSIVKAKREKIRDGMRDGGRTFCPSAEGYESATKGAKLTTSFDAIEGFDLKDKVNKLYWVERREHLRPVKVRSEGEHVAKGDIDAEGDIDADGETDDEYKPEDATQSATSVELTDVDADGETDDEYVASNVKGKNKLGSFDT
ncbi:hypothetical protein T440DRAFT_521869 [Plenodomus tracheiphilus IPT5]|uniref:Uncharacterized protein n=1 Tax=Plenodomus tracheiphilus IPT5 TaxID=1408161 RepID=A0A6A7AU53_9PLEO|nr:hypothetical protein T440DRAFT_521869 [Plenodomus tracheiphilus IPT5]